MLKIFALNNNVTKNPDSVVVYASKENLRINVINMKLLKIYLRLYGKENII